MSLKYQRTSVQTWYGILILVGMYLNFVLISHKRSVNL